MINQEWVGAVTEGVHQVINNKHLGSRLKIKRTRKNYDETTLFKQSLGYDNVGQKSTLNHHMYVHDQ